jgi:hypothetical protein
LAPIVFAEVDWQALAQLLHSCVHWYAPGQLPQQLVQLVVEVRRVGCIVPGFESRMLVS